MSYPSQVIMNDVPLFMTQGYIMNVMQKLGHHPIRATISKDKRSADKAVCTVQFANVDAAREAISQLNGKSVSISGSGSTATTFKLTQGTENNHKLFNVFVGELAPEIDDFRLFKFFGDRFKSLCDAKVIVDSDGKSRGFGFLAFINEEDQKFCVKIMDGSLDLSNRAIKVSTAVAGPPVAPVDVYALRIMSGDPWCRYTSWNQFIEPPEYPFISVKVNLTACKESKDSKDDTKDGKDDASLVKYNVTSNTDYLNHETLERDCHFWDALECSKWLPLMALNLPPSDYADPPAESEAQTLGRKSESNHNLSNGTINDAKEDSKNKNLKRSTVLSKSSTLRPSKVAKKSVSKVVAVSRLLRGKYDLRERAKMAGGVVKRSGARQPSFAETASKIRAQYKTGPPLQRVAMAAAERLSTPAAETRSVRGPETKKLMDKLADEIQDSLTKLFADKGGLSSPKPRPSKPPPLMRIERKTPVGKHPAEKMMESSIACDNCGRTSHRTEKCLLPKTKAKRCFNCLKVATHKAKDCRAPPASISEAIRLSRGVPRGRARPTSRPLGRRMRSRSPPSSPSPRRGPPLRGRPSVRGRSSMRGGPPSFRSGSKRSSPPPRSYSPSPRSYSPPLRSYSPSSRNYSPPPRSFSPPFRSFSPPSARGRPKPQRVGVPTCKVCGNRGHPSHECIKRKSSCHVCKKTGHLAAVCRFRK